MSASLILNRPFRHRCRKADDVCATAFPTVTDTPDGHRRHGVRPQTPGEDAAAASLPESAASAT
ncbi:hypothetical protein [Streptomyces hirsutus]|uniref:hypothetical protein n=1 Tax=Streptomyces hirsutus TaxID=35620 RepID=UPI0033FB1CED